MKHALLAVTILLAAGSPAPAQDVAAFYVGKTIRMVVGVDVGSGYDVNARLLARHMSQHILGNPAFIVQNQRGAGSVTMTSQLYASGPWRPSPACRPFRCCSRVAAASIRPG